MKHVFSHISGAQKIYKIAQVENPPMLIVASLTREQVIKTYEEQEEKEF
jgi:hypothetical protein